MWIQVNEQNDVIDVFYPDLTYSSKAQVVHISQFVRDHLIAHNFDFETANKVLHGRVHASDSGYWCHNYHVAVGHEIMVARFFFDSCVNMLMTGVDKFDLITRVKGVLDCSLKYPRCMVEAADKWIKLNISL